MRRRTITIIIVLIFALGFWWLYEAPFNQEINHQINANVYKDGDKVSETTVVIKGQKTNYLFKKDNRFKGKFIIPIFQTNEDSESEIYNQTYNVYQLVTRSLMPELTQDVYSLFINEEMTNFAIISTTGDNTIIATSDELYQLTLKHAVFEGNGVTLESIDKIPKIK